MTKNRMLLIAGSLLSIAAIGCGGGEAQPASDAPPPEPLPTAESIATGDRPVLVAAVRGEAELGFLQPSADNETIDGQAFIVTDIQVMNLADAPIAGLTVEDLWYDGDGNTISGDTYRHPTPLPPGEPITVTLQVPRVDGLVNNQYQFSHANGEVIPVQMDEFPEPEVPEGEADEAPAE